MVYEEIKYPMDWQLKEIGYSYVFTSKPRGLDINTFEEVPFFPMEYIPLDRLYPDSILIKSGKEIKTGKYFEKGDMLLAKITPSFENGKQAIANIEGYFGYASTEIIPIKHKDNVSDILFLFFLLKDKKVRKYLAGKMDGSTGRQRLSESVLKSFKIPLPPLPEQRKIAAVLSTVQKAIETQAKLIERTTELKKAMMHKLFTEGTRGEKQKITEIGPVPESWDVVRLGKYCELITKGSSPNWQGFKYQDKGILFVRSQNIGWGKIEDKFEFLPEEFNTIQSRSILKPHDILINLVGASIGRVAIAPDYFHGANSNQAVGLVRANQNSFYSKFIMYFLLTVQGQLVLKGNVKEIARANISLSDINNFMIPKTNLEEQEHIIGMLETIDQKISLHTRKKQKLEELFRTLLHQLMTAQIRINDIDISFIEELE